MLKESRWRGRALSHFEQREFIARIKAGFPSFFTSVRTLEVGSLDINGSVRDFFEGGSYIGLDVASGPGVDVVCPGQEYGAPDNSFDTVLSCEAMEHNPYWKETLANMIRVCRPGGLIIMTCATTGRPEHGTTRTSPAESPLTVGLGWDYYKNLTARDVTRAVSMRELLDPFAIFPFLYSYDLYLVGFKRGISAPANARTTISSLRRRYMIANFRRRAKLLLTPNK